MLMTKFVFCKMLMKIPKCLLCTHTHKIKKKSGIRVLSFFISHQLQGKNIFVVTSNKNCLNHTAPTVIDVPVENRLPRSISAVYGMPLRISISSTTLYLSFQIIPLVCGSRLFGMKGGVKMVSVRLTVCASAHASITYLSILPCLLFHPWYSRTSTAREPLEP